MTDTDEEFSKAAAKKALADAERIQTDFREQLEKKANVIAERLEKDMKARFINIALAVLAVVVLVVVGAMYKSMQDVNTSVIALQDRILASQDKIRTATADLAGAQKDLQKARDDLSSASRQLIDTQVQYTARLQELSRPKQQPASP